jgi:hypothetical protein
VHVVQPWTGNELLIWSAGAQTGVCCHSPPRLRSRSHLCCRLSAPFLSLMLAAGPPTTPRHRSLQLPPVLDVVSLTKVHPARTHQRCPEWSHDDASGCAAAPPRPCSSHCGGPRRSPTVATPTEELAAFGQRVGDGGGEGDTKCGRLLMHVASVCVTCFRCLTMMLQIFRADVAEVDLDVSML